MNTASTENVKIRYSELDFDKSLKPSALLNLFQDIAVENADKLGFGAKDFIERKLLWFLLKYHIEFLSYPMDTSELTLKTEPRGYHRLFAYRNFEVYSAENLVVRASSLWSLVNYETKSIVNIDNIIKSPYMPKFVAGDNDLSFERIPSLTKADYQKEFEVRYNDIDGNRHANNGNYVIWGMEPLSYGFRKHHKLKSMDIVFKKEIKYGERLLSQVQFITKDKTVHILKNIQTNEEICQLCCSWN